MGACLLFSKGYEHLVILVGQWCTFSYLFDWASKGYDVEAIVEDGHNFDGDDR